MLLELLSCLVFNRLVLYDSHSELVKLQCKAWPGWGGGGETSACAETKGGIQTTNRQCSYTGNTNNTCAGCALIKNSRQAISNIGKIHSFYIIKCIPGLQVMDCAVTLCLFLYCSGCIVHIADG